MTPGIPPESPPKPIPVSSLKTRRPESTDPAMPDDA